MPMLPSLPGNAIVNEFENISEHEDLLLACRLLWSPALVTLMHLKKPHCTAGVLTPQKA